MLARTIHDITRSRSAPLTVPPLSAGAAMQRPSNDVNSGPYWPPKARTSRTSDRVIAVAIGQPPDRTASRRGPTPRRPRSPPDMVPDPEAMRHPPAVPTGRVRVDAAGGRLPGLRRPGRPVAMDRRGVKCAPGIGPVRSWYVAGRAQESRARAVGGQRPDQG